MQLAAVPPNPLEFLSLLFSEMVYPFSIQSRDDPSWKSFSLNRLRLNRIKVFGGRDRHLRLSGPTSSFRESRRIVYHPSTAKNRSRSAKCFSGTPASSPEREIRLSARSSRFVTLFARLGVINVREAHAFGLGCAKPIVSHVNKLSAWSDRRHWFELLFKV